MKEAVCTEKMQTFDASGRPEKGRYIAPGDKCIIDEILSPGLLIGVDYPVPSGRRKAYVRDLRPFVK